MAKLVERLANELSEWPIENAVCVFDDDGEPSFFTGVMADVCLRCSGDEFDVVTRAKWEAERARIAMNEISAFSQEQENEERARIAKDTEYFANHIGKVQDDAFASAMDELKESLFDIKYEQELWDKVAVACYAQRLSQGRGRLADYAFDDADYFMAERAKRMKG